MNDLKLGKCQWEWLNKYKSIDLQQWRYILINDNPNWLYVGDWKSIKKDGYIERQHNIENNIYHYWPN